MNPFEVRQRDGVYRRGVLLGMTMAEIMILILFCMLMAFVLRLGDYEREKEGSEVANQLFDQLQVHAGSYDDSWKLLSDLQVLIKKLGPDALKEIAEVVENESLVTKEDISAAVSVGLDQYNTLKNELTGSGEHPSTEVVQKAIAERMTAGAEAQNAAPELAALEVVRRIIHDSTGKEPTAQDVMDEVQKIVADSKAWRDGKDLDIVNQYRSAQAENQDLKERLGRLDLALTKATDQLAGKGQGLVYPSCFQTSDGKIQYVFDVGFDEESITLVSLPVLGNEVTWERLQFDQVTTGKAISVTQYLSETLSIFEWSKANACRFFIRVFDRTMAENKNEYKKMKRYLEYRFYTWEPPRTTSDLSTNLESSL